MWEEQIIIGEAVAEYIIKNKSRLSAQDMRALSYFRESAVCVDSPIGEYRCAVEIRYSPQSGKKPICCDTCLQYEVYNLNKKHGITTIGSCCGHARKQAYIQVAPQYVQKMKELGYEALSENGDGQAKWCFKPKTYFHKPVNFSEIQQVIADAPTIIEAEVGE